MYEYNKIIRNIYMNVIDLSLFHQSLMDTSELQHLILQQQKNIIKTAVITLSKRQQSFKIVRDRPILQRQQWIKHKKITEKQKKKIRKLSKIYITCYDMISKLSNMRKIIRGEYDMTQHCQVKQEHQIQEEQLELADLIEKEASEDIECSNYMIGRSDSGFCNQDSNIFNENEDHQNQQKMNKRKQQFYKFSNTSPRLNKSKSNLV